MTDKAVAAANVFFRNLATRNMSPLESAVYDLKIQREALVRDSTDYHKARVHIQRSIEPGAALDAALEKLNRKYPGGYSRKELDAINAAMAQATAALHRSKARNLNPNEHFDSRRTKLGSGWMPRRQYDLVLLAAMIGVWGLVAFIAVLVFLTWWRRIEKMSIYILLMELGL
jgi:hypothetical protein